MVLANFFRIILYLFLAVFLWHTIKRLFLGSGNNTPLNRQQGSNLEERSKQIDYDDIDDAKFEDMNDKD